MRTISKYEWIFHISGIKNRYHGTSMKVLVIIAPQGYQDHEFDGTCSGLRRAGFEIVVGSSNKGECHGKFGGVVQAGIALRDVKVQHYDRVAFIGGPGAKAYDADSDALRIARDTTIAMKPLGAICIAPRILAAAGVLQGRRATVWNDDGTQGKFLEQHGAQYVPESLVVDGLIVTADGPSVAEEFGRALASL